MGCTVHLRSLWHCQMTTRPIFIIRQPTRSNHQLLQCQCRRTRKTRALYLLQKIPKPTKILNPAGGSISMNSLRKPRNGQKTLSTRLRITKKIQVILAQAEILSALGISSPLKFTFSPDSSKREHINHQYRQAEGLSRLSLCDSHHKIPASIRYAGYFEPRRPTTRRTSKVAGTQAPFAIGLGVAMLATLPPHTVPITYAP